MRKCPVCEYALPNQVPAFCPKCGWDIKDDPTIVPSLDNIPDEFLEDYRQRVKIARRNWTERLEAKSKQKELEEEVERVKTEREAEERFWQEIASEDGKEGYETYLKRYTDGHYASQARLRLREIEDSEKASREQAWWKEILKTDKSAGYEEYLKKYPSGKHSEVARLTLERKRRELDSNALRRMVYLFFYYLIPAIAVFIISSKVSFISYLRDMSSNAYLIPSIITSFCIVSSSMFFELVLFKHEPGLIKKLFDKIGIIIIILVFYSIVANLFILALIFLLNVFGILTNLTLSLSIATIVVIPFCGFLHFLMPDMFEEW